MDWMDGWDAMGWDGWVDSDGMAWNVRTHHAVFGASPGTEVQSH